jgi:outer membrane protein
MKHIYIALTMAAGIAGAQQPRRITFNEAVSIALKQNIDVRQAQNAASLSSAAVQQQKMNFLPNLSLNVSGSNNVGRNFSQSEGTIIDQQTQSLSTGISTGITLFDGMKKRVAATRGAGR